MKNKSSKSDFPGKQQLRRQKFKGRMDSIIKENKNKLDVRNKSSTSTF
jgi:hypothetical protein